jgi:hypothetical protein
MKRFLSNFFHSHLSTCITDTVQRYNSLQYSVINMVRSRNAKHPCLHVLYFSLDHAMQTIPVYTSYISVNRWLTSQIKLTLSWVLQWESNLRNPHSNMTFCVTFLTRTNVRWGALYRISEATAGDVWTTSHAVLTIARDVFWHTSTHVSFNGITQRLYSYNHKKTMFWNCGKNQHLIPKDSMSQCVHNVDPAILFMSDKAWFHLGRFATIRNMHHWDTKDSHNTCPTS